MRQALITFAILVAVGSATAAAFDIKGDPVGYLEGTWHIGKKWYCPGMCAMDEAAAKAFRGRSFEYSGARMSNGQKTCGSPKYVIRRLSAEQFFRDYRCAPADIGLLGKVVKEISVECEESGVIWPTVGNLALIKDRGTFLTLWDGVFFEVHRD